MSIISYKREQYFCRELDGGVFLSTNNGSSWTDVSNGLTGGCALDVYSFAISGILFLQELMEQVFGNGHYQKWLE